MAEEQEVQDYSNSLSPDVIPALGPRIAEQDYDSAIKTLSDLYNNNTWSDQEAAAQNFGELSDYIAKQNNVTPEFQLPTTSVDLGYRLMDKTLNQNDKIQVIEDWRLSSKEQLYNSKDPQHLLFAKSKEELIDDYANQLRRGVVSGNVGTITDSIARGVEGVFTPLVGTADILLGTDLKDSFKDATQAYQNPDNDGSLVATAASVTGAVGGFAISSLNPITAWGYLGATVASQAKDVYDSALQQSGSEEAAGTALKNSIPGLALGVLSDRLVGTALAGTIKGQKGLLGTVGGIVSGAGGNVAQSALVGEGLAQATGEKQFVPTVEQLAIEAAAGGVVGGLVGGYADLQSKQVESLRHQIVRTIKGETSKDVQAQKESAFSKFIIKDRQEPSDTLSSLEDKLSEKLGTKEPTPPREPNEPILEDYFPEGVIPKKVLSESPVDYSPSPYMLYMARELGLNLKLSESDNTLGFVQPKGKVFGIKRALFSDLDSIHKTIAHELGHAFDLYRYENTVGPYDGQTFAKEPLVFKFVHFGDLIGSVIDNAALTADSIKLSKEWRPGWDETASRAFQAYRNSKAEIQADVYSAILNNPAGVQAEYPRIWDAFQKALDIQPPLKKFWDEVVGFNKDPQKFMEFLTKQYADNRKIEGQLVKLSAEEALAKKRDEAREALPRAIKAFKPRFINKFTAARDVLTKLTGPSKDLVEAHYNKLYAFTMRHDITRAFIDAPVKKTLDKYLAEQFPVLEEDAFGYWKNYERANRVLNETTETMESIKSTPNEYKKAYLDIYQAMNDLYGADNPMIGIMQTDVTTLAGEGLVDEMAKLKAWVPKKAAALISNRFLDAGNLKAVELLSNEAFNVRKYLPNPDIDPASAKRMMATMRQQLGENKFNALSDISKEFHNILGTRLFNLVEESGIVSPGLLRRMQLNKNNYVTFNVLKYFAEDPDFSGTIREQYGTLDKIGDELAATIGKTKAILARAYYQRGVNSAVKIARLGSYEVDPVPLAHNKDVFEQRTLLQAKDKDNSYLVEYEQGKPTLYRINSPNFAKMFEPSAIANNNIMNGVLTPIEAMTRILGERELKTILNPAFFLSQKFMDRANEAILARSWEFPLLPFHTSRSLRKIRADARKIFNEIKPGELSGDSPSVFSEDAQNLLNLGVLPYHIAAEHGGQYGSEGSSANAVYEAMGVRVPDEQETTSVKINKMLNQLIDKVTFGAAPVLRSAVERDEALTKISAYLIGTRIRGKSPQEAARMAREYAGTPDPYGGGTEAASINKLFLFGRAHINGMRSVYNQFKDDRKGYAVQYAFRKGIPRLLATSAFVTPLIQALFGEENAKVYKAYLDKLPSFTKSSKYTIPLGFRDENGEFRGFNVKSEDITQNWKSVAFQVPYSRELVTVDTLLNTPYRALEELLETGTINAKHIGQNVAESMGSIFVGQFAPPIQRGVQLGGLALGMNPYDFYRNKGILPRDVQEAGTMVQKMYEYLGWAVTQTAPGLISSNIYKQTTTESLSPFDHLSKLLGVGPILRRFVTETNYGDYEQNKELQQKKAEVDAEIRLGLQDESKRLYYEYTKAQSLVSKLGKDWTKAVSPKEQTKIHALFNWHARAYRYAFNEMRSAFEKGEASEIQDVSDALERSSRLYAEQLGFPSR